MLNKVNWKARQEWLYLLNMKGRGNFLIIVLVLIMAIGNSGCSKKSCPTFDTSARQDGSMPRRSAKSKSGVVPKDFGSKKTKKAKTKKKKPTDKKKEWK